MSVVTQSPSPNDDVWGQRRTPVQKRSRARVEAILDAAASLALEQGVEQVTTRAIADRAGMPVATLYQYFSDRDEVLYALIEADMIEMDTQVFTAVGALDPLTAEGVIKATIDAYVGVYRRRPAFVEIWMRGRANASIRKLGREHNQRTAALLQAFLADAQLIDPQTPAYVGELAVELGDRALQLAFETEIEGDDFKIGEAIRAIVGYLGPWFQG